MTSLSQCFCPSSPWKPNSTLSVCLFWGRTQGPWRQVSLELRSHPIPYILSACPELWLRESRTQVLVLSQPLAAWLSMAHLLFPQLSMSGIYFLSLASPQEIFAGHLLPPRLWCQRQKHTGVWHSKVRWHILHVWGLPFGCRGGGENRKDLLSQQCCSIAQTTVRTGPTLYIRSPELMHLITGSLYSWIIMFGT